MRHVLAGPDCLDVGVCPEAGTAPGPDAAEKNLWVALTADGAGNKEPDRIPVGPETEK